MGKTGYRAAAAALLLCVLLSALIGCASETPSAAPGTAPADTTTAAAETAPAETGRAARADGVPADLDFDGEVLDFMVRDTEQYYRELIADDLTGQLVNDAIHERNETVADALHIGYNYVRVGSSWRDQGTTTGILRGSIEAGDHAYDVFVNGQYFVGQMAMEGLMYDVTTLPYIDLEQPWWNRNFIDQVKYKGQLYMLDGEISLNTLDYVYCIYFNQDLLNEYHGGTNLYQIVKDGAWTIDRLSELAEGVYKDVNGDGARDLGDIYGMNVSKNSGEERSGYTWAFGIGYTVRNEKNEPVLRPFDERIADTFSVVYRLINTNSGVYCPENENESLAQFIGGRALFHTGYIRRAVFDLPEMEDLYGILPMPKMNEAQKEYLTNSQDSHNQYGVLNDVENPRMVSAALEKMCAENYRSVTEMYYNTALKGRYFQDRESGEMLEIIMGGIVIDFGYQFHKGYENFMPTPGDEENIASTYAARFASAETKFAAMLEIFEKNLH